MDKIRHKFDISIFSSIFDVEKGASQGTYAPFHEGYLQIAPDNSNTIPGYTTGLNNLVSVLGSITWTVHSSKLFFMDAFVQKLLLIPLNYVVIALVVIFYSLEQLFDKSGTPSQRTDHLFNNILFRIALVGVSYFFAIGQVYCIQWLNNHHFGLFHYLQISFIYKVILGVAFFDLTTYWFHRWAHISPLIWRLHRVHHSDTAMDTSTFFRNHPLELLVTGCSTIVASAIFGLDARILAIYIFILIPFTIAQHTNIHLPEWTDKLFGKVFITPNLHKVHHARDKVYTDSNFGDIFVFWDKLFGTYKYLPPNQIAYGLHEFDEEKKQTFWYLLKSPFLKTKRLPENK